MHHFLAASGNLGQKIRRNYPICVIGAGAIGGVIAGVLAREKYNVRLLTKYEELAGKISNEGIRVSGHCGDFSLKVPSVGGPEELEGLFDYVLIATKAAALEQVAEAMLPYMDENSRAVSLQNGICEDILAGVVGAERTVGCVVGWGGTMHEPGKVEMTSGGEFIVGNWDREGDKQLSELADMLNHIVPVKISGNIYEDLYSKLIINSCITTLGAVCGQYLGEMLADRHVRDIFINVIGEAIDVANAMDIEVPPAANGKLNYYSFLSHGVLSGLRRHLMIRIIGMKYSKLKSSSLQSLERGQKTEVENYNGYIAARGKENGVPTPVNEKLTGIVREIEEGKRPISPENFREVSVVK
jgi:2-dehydropantoate 2-reductase